MKRFLTLAIVLILLLVVVAVTLHLFSKAGGRENLEREDHVSRFKN